jgi:hypothetical protein
MDVKATYLNSKKLFEKVALQAIVMGRQLKKFCGM